MVLSIILFPYHFIKSKFRDLLSEIDVKYNISKKLAHLLSLLLWILGCYLASIIIYFIFYNYYIPIVHQSSRLAFTKTDFGSTARIYNSRDDFPLCQNPLLINRTSQGLVQTTPSPQNKICKNPVNLGTSIEFVNQDYFISIQLDLNEQVKKPEDNVLVSSFEVINKNNEVLEVTREGLTNIPTQTYTIAQMMDMMKQGVGIGENSHQTEIVLSEKFANSAFGIHVINIDIPKSYAFITNGTIKVEAILSGLGRFMYYWFWSSAVLFVNLICISTIFGTIYGRQFGERVFLVGKIYLNKLLMFVDGLHMFLVNKKLEIIGYYRRKVQKQRERVDKIAAYKKRIMEYSQRVIDIQKEKATGICSRRKKKIVGDINKLD